MPTIQLHGNVNRPPKDRAALHIGSEVGYDGTLMFDMGTEYGGQYHNACSNINRADAEAIIEALRAVFPVEAEAAPEEPVADIALPDLYESGDPSPAIVAVEIDGHKVTLANWLDYKGWEVRRRAGHDGEAGLLLGYISGSEGAWTVKATRPVPTQVSSTHRVDVALRTLIKAANA